MVKAGVVCIEFGGIFCGVYLCSSAADALEKREVKCERVKVGSVVTRCVPWFFKYFKVYGGKVSLVRGRGVSGAQDLQRPSVLCSGYV